MRVDDRDVGGAAAAAAVAAHKREHLRRFPLRAAGSPKQEQAQEDWRWAESVAPIVAQDLVDQSRKVSVAAAASRSRRRRRRRRSAPQKIAS
jgi:hypothetical protein